MLTTIFPPKKSLKNIIMNILLESDNCDIRTIRQAAKKHGISATYQGVHKILNQLFDEGVVKKDDHTWKINDSWIKSVSAVFSNYGKIPLYTPEMKSITLGTLSKSFKFILSNIDNDRLRGGGEHFFIGHFANLAFFVLTKKQRRIMRKFSKQTECHVLVVNNNLVNRLAAKYLRSIGVKTYVGIARSTPYAIVVYGNTIFEIHPTKDFIPHITKQYSSIKSLFSLENLKVFDTLEDDPRFPLKFRFETDPQIVQLTKDFLLQLAQNKK